MTEQDFRANIVRIAREWVGTPYRLNQCCKGAGTDCARLLFGVMHEAGLLADEKMEVFSQDWFCHTDQDAYLLRVMRHASKVAEGIAYVTLNPKPGCLVLVRAANSRVWNHGGIVTGWPRLVHAIHPSVMETSAASNPMWMHKEVIVFDPWKDGEAASA